MTHNILLVAMREFRQITGMRSFWLTLLILPLALAVGPIASRLTQSEKTQRVMLIDADGRSAAAIRARLDTDHQRRVLTALSRYAQRYGIDRADPGALWAQHDRLFGDADVATFVKAGGLPAALAAMRPATTSETPKFDRARGRFRGPADAARHRARARRRARCAAQAAAPAGRIRGQDGQAARLCGLCPTRFRRADRRCAALVERAAWRNFVQPLQTVLTQDLRTAYLESTGLARDQARIATSLVPAIAVSTPAPGAGANGCWCDRWCRCSAPISC
ncbi:hypothetical protein QP185_13275 [Sphingomonas aerolata]|uniref:hypothetical protein n=1 Tax=Sphingomonas aerolata TaxID=185951 RepID=UPI002FE22134